MKSKKALFAALDNYFETGIYTTHGLKAKGIDNETYGNKSCIYILCPDSDTRGRLQDHLQSQGFKVWRDYSQGGKRVEVQVSYFRGTRWDV